MSWIKRVDSQRLHDMARGATETATTAPAAPPPMKPQQLGPNQLKWLEERFRFYGIHRKQAEAPTGVAVIQGSSLAMPTEISQ